MNDKRQERCPRCGRLVLSSQIHNCDMCHTVFCNYCCGDAVKCIAYRMGSIKHYFCCDEHWHDYVLD